MKKFLSIIFTILILFGIYYYKEDIVKYTFGVVSDNIEVKAPNSNNYKENYNFQFVKNTDNFHVSNKQDILNVIYTILNSGDNEFTFYCQKDYQNCESDLKEISENSDLLTVLNNMVSPFNSYEKMYVTINNYGKATISFTKLYSSEDITNINNKLDEIQSQIITNNMTDYQKIRAFHDYIINNTVYDEERADEIESGSTKVNNNSHKANGPLFEGKALCSGYSDVMKLFLDRLGLPNYKISTSNHIWNYVYINGSWKHLDLTWDDPVTNTHQNMLLHKYFLIDTSTLLNNDRTEHSYNPSYYPEASY